MTVLPPAATWIFHRTRNSLLIVVIVCIVAGLRCNGAIAVTSAGVVEQNGGSFEMQMLYKYSQEFREVITGRPEWQHLASEEWPLPGSPEFYHTLVVQDRHKHRAARNLLTNDTDAYSLLPRNATYFISTLGGIHYTFIALGTPPKRFLVGLDTGSDLLWVPCDCQSCSAASWANYGLDLNMDFAIYSPTNSTSSKSVPCNSAICKTTLSPSSCDANTIKPCTYTSKYLSPNTSSSGTIVQDAVYLNSESGIGQNVSADIYLGCGSLQTGDFLKGGAPNGLFGLGPETYSVPRTLARAGVIRDVFSMCFANISSVGRLVFGKKPASSLSSTPIIPNNPNVFYVLGLEGMVAGGAKLNVSRKVVFDTGTSFTTLSADIIKLVGDALASKTTLETWSFKYSDSLQLSYCWNATTDADIESLSSLSFIFGGGGVWNITSPLLGFGNESLDFVCLGILPSETLDAPPIIGYNFMSMYEYYFDMEASTFSWSPSDCSGLKATGATVIPPISAPSPSPKSAPSASEKSPSTSPSMAENTSPPNEAPSTNGTQSSNAHTSVSQNIPFQLLCLLVSTLYVYSLAN